MLRQNHAHFSTIVLTDVPRRLNPYWSRYVHRILPFQNSTLFLSSQFQPPYSTKGWRRRCKGRWKKNFSIFIKSFEFFLYIERYLYHWLSKVSWASNKHCTSHLCTLEFCVLAITLIDVFVVVAVVWQPFSANPSLSWQIVRDFF